ncbi:MAG: 8-amino-7-oxononanoate synthase [Blastocatellia bacterium]|nr:8-amino-7-oxononanoate synthase [Blastocatellia bacterium]
MRDFSSLENELQEIRRLGRYRSLRMVAGVPEAEITIRGQRLINFSSNNYLGLAAHPRLLRAARQATDAWGTGSGASRLICGNLELHEALEAELARFKGTAVPNARALLFNSGYHANIGIIPALMTEGDVIFSDALNHASLIDGCRMSRAKTVVYAHANPENLAQKIREHPTARRRLIVTDSVFSMDGDWAPLKEIVETAERSGAWVMVDEAHATGVLGHQGRGLVDHLGLSGRIELQMGTLGKALGSFGAFVVAPAPFIEVLINRARSFIFTTSLPPAPVAAALEALVMLRESAERQQQLHENIRFFNSGLKELGWGQEDAQAPIFPVILGDEARTMEAMERLWEAGIFASGIRPPTVPPGTCRLRLTVMATHTRKHLEQGLEALRYIKKLRTAN